MMDAALYFAKPGRPADRMGDKLIGASTPTTAPAPRSSSRELAHRGAVVRRALPWTDGAGLAGQALEREWAEA